MAGMPRLEIQDKTVRRGQPGQNSIHRAARKGQPELDKQNGTTRTGQNKTGRTGQIGGETEHIGQDRIAKTDCEIFLA
jgi:hypothetical protein